MNWFHFVMKSVRIVNVFPIQLKIIVKEYVVEHCKECLDDIHYHEHQYLSLIHILPHIYTLGNSNPFALCNVIKRT